MSATLTDSGISPMMDGIVSGFISHIKQTIAQNNSSAVISFLSSYTGRINRAAYKVNYPDYTVLIILSMGNIL